MMKQTPTAIRSYRRPSPYKGLGRMLLISFVVHLVVFGLFSGDLLPRKKYKRPPAIRVNLANLPVANPQAGRPDAVKTQKKPKKATPKPTVKAKPKPKPKPKVIAPPKPKPEPKPKVAKKPEPKKVAPKKPAPKKVATKPTKSQEKSLQERMEALRQKRAEEQERQQRQQKIDDLKKKLAALSSAPGDETSGPDAPVGEPDGKGTEEGISDTTWIKTYIQEQWRLSKYQLSRRDLSAVVRVIYNADGRLLDYNFLRKSGDATFDDSLQNAILKAKEFPRALGKRTEFDITFNLSEMQD